MEELQNSAKNAYSLADAAELLDCHKETLRRAIKKGVLKAAKIGRDYRISRHDLEIFYRDQGGGFLFSVDGL